MTDRTSRDDQADREDADPAGGEDADSTGSEDADSAGGEDADSTGDAASHRVLAAPDGGPLRLLDLETYEPVVTAVDGHDVPVDDLRSGYLVDADLDWSTAEPTVRSASVVRPTLYAFADDVDPMFEAARDAWNDARAAGDSMNSRVTRNTDSEVNGVLYVFAEDERNGTFEAFRDGGRPVEPLVDRVNEQEGPAPREVFVLRPADGRYVAVTIALRKGGQFADTLRETYDLSRPDEPVA